MMRIARTTIIEIGTCAKEGEYFEEGFVKSDKAALYYVVMRNGICHSVFFVPALYRRGERLRKERLRGEGTGCKVYSRFSSL
jgi:hypothetical protein